MEDSAFSPMGSMALGVSNGGGGGGGVRGSLGGLVGVLGSGFASPRFPLSRGDAETLSTTSSREHLKTLDVEELEMLLEAYFVQIEGTLNKLATVRGVAPRTRFWGLGVLGFRGFGVSGFLVFVVFGSGSRISGLGFGFGVKCSVCCGD